jgi:SEC-C motif domain protein
MTEPEPPCPCGRDRALPACCGPLLKGEKKASTAEDLMRARYTAFATGNVDFIMNTHDPDTVDQIDRNATERWAKDSEWLALEVLKTEGGEESAQVGTVDFLARYRTGQTTTEHRERAKFRKREGRWMFVDGGPIPKVKKILVSGFVKAGKKHKKKKA